MSSKRVAVLVMVLLCGVGVAVAQTEWVDYPANPVLGPGDSGSWDEGGRWIGAVVLVDSTFHMWYVGWNADSPAGLVGIGHATSSDGVEWTMDASNPVLEPGEPGDWDAYLWAPTPAVLYDGTQYHMWYVAGTSSTDDSTLRGGYAISPDGSVWTKYVGNPVLEVGPPGSWDDNSVVPGSAIFDSGVFKLWYSGYNGSAIQIGYAESTDGIEWTKHVDPVLGRVSYPGAWDSGVSNPSVVHDGSVYHMWYAGGGDRSVVSIGYAFSSDGIEWFRNRDNPVIAIPEVDVSDMKVVSDGSVLHGWYRRVGIDQPTSYATSTCCPGVAGLTHSQFIPAAAVASGAEGAFFQTDVDLSNAGSQSVQYQLMWLPRGEDNSAPMTSEIFNLGAGMSVRYSNLLSEIFGLEPNSLGALVLISSRADLLAMSRTYNIPGDGSAGTFGQAIPAVAPEEFISSGERQRILFASENDDLRFNIGCQNGSGEVTGVSVELFDAEGTSLERTMMVLPAWGNDQLNRIFEDYQPVNGYVDVWTVQGGRSFTCYGSVLDNVTSDPTTILPQ